MSGLPGGTVQCLVWCFQNLATMDKLDCRSCYDGIIGKGDVTVASFGRHWAIGKEQICLLRNQNEIY